MTVIIVCAFLLVLSTSVFIVANRKDWIIPACFSLVIFIASIVFLIVGMIIYIPSHKDSEIEYEQLVQERRSIEAMIETDNAADRIALNGLMIDYNNRVIQAKNNSQRPIFKEYYSNNVDWMALEIVDWR